jgi:hypothetical protein
MYTFKKGLLGKMADVVKNGVAEEKKEKTISFQTFHENSDVEDVNGISNRVAAAMLEFDEISGSFDGNHKTHESNVFTQEDAYGFFDTDDILKSLPIVFSSLVQVFSEHGSPEIRLCSCCVSHVSP